MPELSRLQMLVYGAVAVAILLIGARWIRSGGQSAAEPGGGVAGPGAPGSDFEVDRGGGELVVHVAGAVQNPGVYRLPNGSRVTDAVERAGGSARAALPDSINLAAELADGQQVVVPARAGTPAAAATAAVAQDGPISLGTATVEDLDTIDGIGPVTAQGILEYRDEHGGISSIDDLDQISGIGPATMEALRDGLQP